MSFSVEIKGINRVSNALRKLLAMDRTIIEPELRDWTQRVRKLLKSTPYPSRRAGQKYRRTGRLANSWAAESTGKGQWSIANRAEYSTWVVGDDQAAVHAGRWWQARPTIEAEMPELTRALSEKIEGTWDRG